MISRIIDFSIRRRWFVVLAALAACALGAWALARIPIDAVPDITNNQVQINTFAPALSPVEIEKQVTFRIETALAGMPGPRIHPLAVAQRLLAGHRGVRREDEHLLRPPAGQRAPARSPQQPSARRRAEDRAGLHRARRDLHVDGRVRAAPRAARRRTDGPAGRATAPISPRKDSAWSSELERAAYLRTVQDWIIRPQLKSVPGVAGVDAIGGYVKQYHVQPDPRS